MAEKRFRRLNANTTIAESPVRSGDQIFVPERSWINRNTGVFAAAVTTILSLTIAIFIR